MKIAIAILILIVVGLGWQLNGEMATNNRQRGQIAALTSKLIDKTARENFELQEKCAKQADKVFRELGYNLNADSNQSHFNVKLNRCFMSFGTGSVGKFPSKYLIDAYEQRQYAEYFVFIEGRSEGCSLTPLGEKEHSCKSKEEYNEFVAKYME